MTNSFCTVGQRYWNPAGRVFNRNFSDISVVLRETTLTISDSIETGSPVEPKMVRIVSIGTMEITEITRFNPFQNDRF